MPKAIFYLLKGLGFRVQILGLWTWGLDMDDRGGLSWGVTKGEGTIMGVLRGILSRSLG